MRTTARGFTLVELVLATALMGVMMGMVMLAIGAIGRDRERLVRAESPDSLATDAVFDLVRRDLANARRIRSDEKANGFVLLGYGAMDPATLEPNGRLARVAYAVVDHRLVRSQSYHDDPLRRSWSELVSHRVNAISIKLLPDPPPTNPPGPATEASAKPAREDEMKSVRVSPSPQRLTRRAIVTVEFQGREAIAKPMWLR